MDVFVWRLGGARWGLGHPPIPAHPARRGGRCSTIRHSSHPDAPISAYIDEDALEGLYFGDRRILRCLPYFCEKTRPRGSCELLEALSPSLTADGASGATQSYTPTLQSHTLTPRHPHLTPNRRGCPRRGLFRVFVHPKVFTLLFAENAS